MGPGGKNNKSKDTTDGWVEVYGPSCGVAMGVRMNVVETGVGEGLWTKVGAEARVQMITNKEKNQKDEP